MTSVIVFLLWKQGMFSSMEEADFVQRWLSTRLVPNDWRNVEKMIQEAIVDYKNNK